MASTSTTSVELDPVTQQKLDTAKQKKETADQAFKAGQVKDGGAPPPTLKEGEEKKPEKTEVDEMVEKIYNNMSACHMKNENWQRALETANKALAKNEENWKAMFRKGKALGELGYYERAAKVLEDLKTKNPSDGANITAELARLKAIDVAKQKAINKKLKGQPSKRLPSSERSLKPWNLNIGFLSRPEKEKKAPSTPAAASAASSSASGIEEIVSPGVAASRS
ncbi:hypothetical protein HWV62_25058 [Athelia sp. TMB]|nr:hypothetical protein HWV62_25058 [Athelia sp. TMB]